ncbi:MAG: TMEM165/GDT1 family protein [Spirochaetales bacterium]|nr:TMEM165/GDT1 family protein [Spirochaetales bacterium]
MLVFDIGVMLTTFFVVFAAELGDKTQLVAFSITSTSRHPLVIFFATSLALSCSSVLAALIGGAASRLLGTYTSFIAAALFFGFGFYILFSKEAPPVKDCFLKTIAVETGLLRVVPGLFKRRGRYDEGLLRVLRQDSGHALVFRLLLKEKRLFKDDINEDQRLCELTEKLRLARGLRRLPFRRALEEIVRTEEAVRDVYGHLHEHLRLEHHAADRLEDLLAGLEAEESEHVAFFKSVRDGENA